MRSFFLIALIGSSAWAECLVDESSLFGIFVLESGSSPIQTLDLFWEDGGYIFNAETSDNQRIAGGWTYSECELVLTYQRDEVEAHIVIEVEVYSDLRLTTRLKGESNSILFLKAEEWPDSPEASSDE